MAAVAGTAGVRLLLFSRPASHPVEDDLLALAASLGLGVVPIVSPAVSREGVMDAIASAGGPVVLCTECTWRLTSGPICGPGSEAVFDTLGHAALTAAARAADPGPLRSSRHIALRPETAPDGVVGAVLLALGKDDLSRPWPAALLSAALRSARSLAPPGCSPPGPEASARHARRSGLGGEGASLPRGDVHGHAAAAPASSSSSSSGPAVDAEVAASIAAPASLVLAHRAVPGGPFVTGRGVAAPRPRRGTGAAPSLAWYRTAPAPALRRSVVLTLPDCLVVRDPFPKSAAHLLLLPSPGSLAAGDVACVGDLRPPCLPRLRRLHAVARAVAAAVEREVMARRGPPRPAWLRWRIGYHSPPSLRPLHLHVLTADLQSPCLKTAAHVNRFASGEHFVTAEAVEAALEAGRAPDGDPREQPRCPECAARLPDALRAMKDHLASCIPLDAPP